MEQKQLHNYYLRAFAESRMGLTLSSLDHPDNVRENAMFAAFALGVADGKGNGDPRRLSVFVATLNELIS